MNTRRRIHHKISSGQTHDGEWNDVNFRSTTQLRKIVYTVPQDVPATTVCRTIVFLQLLYRWQHQSRKLWILVIYPLPHGKASELFSSVKLIFFTTKVVFLLKSWEIQNFITIKTSWNTND
jgi:hypothetical protein